MTDHHFRIPIKAPSKLMMAWEARAPLEVARNLSLLPWLRRFVPAGDGHPVMVLPGFLASSRSTAVLRWFLKDRGYSAHRWRLGRNLGYNEEVDRGMQDRLKALADRYGEPVSLIGWSLGGVFARELARSLPEETRLVVSMGSPFRGQGTGTNVDGIYKLVVGHHPTEIDNKLRERVVAPPPVPTTALYSRTDGITGWRSTMEKIAHRQVENIEVGGSHFGFGFNPLALYAIGDRLTHDKASWRPFSPGGALRRLFSVQNAASQRVTDKPVKSSLGDLRNALDELELALADRA